MTHCSVLLACQATHVCSEWKQHEQRSTPRRGLWVAASAQQQPCSFMRARRSTVSHRIARENVTSYGAKTIEPEVRVRRRTAHCGTSCTGGVIDQMSVLHVRMTKEYVRRPFGQFQEVWFQKDLFRFMGRSRPTMGHSEPVSTSVFLFLFSVH
jgi:hypothetical protein